MVYFPSGEWITFRAARPRIGYTRDFSRYREAFAAWDFQNRDFETLPLRKDDLVYADPPYDVEFTQYSQGGFSWDDQVRAAE